MKKSIEQMLRSGASLALLASLVPFAMPASAFAQDQDEETAGGSSSALEEIVVTGTSKARTGLSTPLSVTQLNEEQLQKFTASSQADVLRFVPTIKAEGGGGEVASNVFIKGLPSGGQFQFTPLNYDGSPSFSVFGLNSSAFDVYYRNDLGIERVEFVRGGVSNLFGTGSVAGIINYISKTGSDETEGTAQIEWADEGRFRGDFATSGALSKEDGLYYAVSGYYRYDEGPIKTGLPTEGFQLRGNLKKEFSDGTGSFTLFGQWIDDEVQFFLPFPLDGESRNRTIGNDGNVVETVQTSEAANISYLTPNGRFETPIADGVSTKGGSVSAVFDKDFDNGWGVNAKAKYARYSHQFNLFLDGDGFVNTPETQAGFLTFTNDDGEFVRQPQLTDDQISRAIFTFVNSGEELPADFLLFGNRLLDRNRPATDFTTEINITKELTTGELDHSFTFGGFFARAEADDERVLTTFLGDFNNRSRLVDVTILDANGDVETRLTENGLISPGHEFRNERHEATRFAGYIADQIEMDRWVFDIGLRVEKLIGDISREGFEAVVFDDDPTLAPLLQTREVGSGSFTQGRVSTTEWAFAGGVLYKLTDDVSLYANGSRGYFFPQIRSVGFDEFGRPASYEGEIIKQAEFGVKYNGSRVSATFGAFWAKLSDRRNVDFVNDGSGGVREEVELQSTRTFGLEATANVYITDHLWVNGNITLQDHEFTQVDGDPDQIGNELRRQPNVLFNTGIYYDDDTFDLAFFQNYVGSNFANDSNSVKLDSYSIARLDGGYTFNVADGQTARIGFGIYNLFDSDGISEGSPRQGSNQSNTGEFFVGRPILPRRYTVRFTYNF